MNASDIMTADVVTVAPGTRLEEVVRLMLAHRISGLPVLDGAVVVGMITEGDLLRRPENGTERRHSWLALFRSEDKDARDYVRSHGVTAGEVMTTDVVTVADTTPVSDIAQLLESRGIKRAPVLRAGKLVGIVARADLLRTLGSRLGARTRDTDEHIRTGLLAELASHPTWAPRPAEVSVLVQDGVVHYWGSVRSPSQRAAMIVAAERMPGVLRVEDHLLDRDETDPLLRLNWPSPARP